MRILTPCHTQLPLLFPDCQIRQLPRGTARLSTPGGGAFEVTMLRGHHHRATLEAAFLDASEWC